MAASAISMAKVPKVSIHFQKPGFTPTTPEELERLEPLYAAGGTRIKNFSPTVAVKYGSRLEVKEATTMIFIAEHTSIPVPKVHAVYTYGPFDRPDFDAVDEYDTYIFMDYIDGETLEKAWENLDGQTKSSIMADLKHCLEELRSLQGGTYVGSLEYGPVMDQIVEWHNINQDLKLTGSTGPFTSVKDFHDTVIDAYCKIRKGHVRPYITGMLNTREYGIVFTHADLRPPNIMIKDGHIVGIIDWEMSGWYPEWWEFAKAFLIWKFPNDWGTYLLEIMKPYYLEAEAHAQLMQMLL
ncbi:hypothetical protein Dda_2142 [Drechslerella dactyloides]|uniref:Aminoglycoside phosphotransferase domain-containing protein n=1 Tax=Drechslerella dactyloides TaxID=74499 RepID=A0AAD6J2Z4_DREDA|nr:hypothetical protein Dda_2142 [Drechslerella dactyloides]